MKTKNITALLFAIVLTVLCTSCSSPTSTPTPTTEAKTNAPVSEVITETTSPSSSATSTLPDNTIINTTVITPTPDDTPFNPDTFKNTYWINSSLGIGYFFKDNGNATVFMTETKSESTYSFNETTLTLDTTSLPYSVKESKLIITFFDGLDVPLDKATEDQFKELIKETEVTAEADYIGLTVKEFVQTGAKISGYTGFNGEYEFTAYNTEKNEKYTLVLTGGNVKDALNSKTLGDEYEDVLGDFVISEITVIKLDATQLQKYLGKTVAEFEADGFEINGFIHVMDLTLFARDKNNNSIEITLNGNANEVYKGLEDPFDADMGEVFATFTIKTIKYSSY